MPPQSVAHIVLSKRGEWYSYYGEDASGKAAVMVDNLKRSGQYFAGPFKSVVEEALGCSCNK